LFFPVKNLKELYMSDDGGFRITAGGGGGNDGDPKQVFGAIGGIINVCIKIAVFGVKTAVTFPAEVFLFFSDRENKQRYHWAHYTAWAVYASAFGVFISQVVVAAVGDWAFSSFGTLMAWFIGMSAVAGVGAAIPLGLERFCEKRGNWLAWYPGLGYKTNITQGGLAYDWAPMPWASLVSKLPLFLQLGPKGPLEKLFSVSIARNNVATSIGEAKGTKTAAAPVQFLPMPEYVPFGLGAANVGETVLRGTKIIDGFAYRKTLENAASSRREGGLNGGLLTFGAVPMAYDVEPQHLLISGKSGAGKTQEINAILRTARNWRGNAALIADPAGGYLARFGRDTDSVLNPFDERSESWSPFAPGEIVHDYDCATIAKATIPDGEGSSGEWNHYAQSLLTEVLKALWNAKETDATRVLYFCSTAPAEELKKLLDGTPAAILTHKGNERMLGSVRGIISTYMGAWQYLKPDGDFSVRKFVRESDSKGGAFLFMTYSDAQMGMLKGLIATWMELAIIEGLSMSESNTRRLWVVLDELDSLGKISSLKAGLTKLRKYGVCCICGIQTVAQLRSTYGRDDAQTLLSCMATKLILPPGDNETADYMSKELGEQEIERLQTSEGSSQKTGFMTMDHDKNASTNQHLHRQTQAAVMPSQLLSLPNLQGYVRMPGTDVFQVVIPYVSMPDINKPFEAANR
jgi:type IV secretory pathway TraG/TraD family ATPase VirD4